MTSRTVRAIPFLLATLAFGISAHAQKKQDFTKKVDTPTVKIAGPAGGFAPPSLAQQRKTELSAAETTFRPVADRLRPSITTAAKKNGYDLSALEQRVAGCQKLKDEAFDKCVGAIAASEGKRMGEVLRVAGIDVQKEQANLASALKLPAPGSGARKKWRPAGAGPAETPPENNTLGVGELDPPLTYLVPLPSAVRDVKSSPFTVLATEGGGRNDGKQMSTLSGAGGASAWYSRVSMSANTSVPVYMRRVQARTRIKYMTSLMVVVGLGYASGEIKATFRLFRGEREVCKRERSLDHLFAPIFAVYSNNQYVRNEWEEVELGCEVTHDNREGGNYSGVIDLEVWTGAGGIAVVTAGGVVEPQHITFESTASQ